jgi:trans-2,3-dihydro-3-hydroxyanthranilate isomerase
MIFEEKAGLVRIDLLREQSAVTGARLAAPQAFSIGKTIAREIVAAACSLAEADIDTRAHQPCVASCGIPLVFAAVTSRAALAAARPRTEIFAQHVPATLATGILLYLEAAAPAADIEARMFAPLYGVMEDPATGSANVALIALLATLRAEPDLRLERKISQGVDMGRPSLLLASAEKRAGKVVAAYIGGKCVPVMRGVIEVA